MAFTKKHAQQNREMLAYALRILDSTDTTPLNHRADRDMVLDIMATVFPEVKPYRRRLVVGMAIMRLRAKREDND